MLLGYGDKLLNIYIYVCVRFSLGNLKYWPARKQDINTLFHLEYMQIAYVYVCILSQNQSLFEKKNLNRMQEVGLPADVVGWILVGMV